MSRWFSAWKDILNDGSPRWKITSKECHEKAYAHFQKYVHAPLLNNNDNDNDNDNDADDDVHNNISVLCPLSGDDKFVYLLYRKGYSVTCIDLVPEALASMRQWFIDNEKEDDEEDIWTKEELLLDDDDDDDDNNNNNNNNGDDDDDDVDVVWRHKSGRVILIVGDVLKKRPTLNNSFDAVYDKDSFGALPKELRKSFCERIAEYTKENAIVYLECKLKKKQKEGHDTVNMKIVGDGSSGANTTTSTNNNVLWDPPYSLEKEDLMEDDNYGGTKFDYVEQLGVVYELLDHTVNTVMEQTGHILRRCKNNTHSS